MQCRSCYLIPLSRLSTSLPSSRAELLKACEIVQCTSHPKKRFFVLGPAGNGLGRNEPAVHTNEAAQHPTHHHYHSSNGKQNGAGCGGGSLGGKANFARGLSTTSARAATAASTTTQGSSDNANIDLDSKEFRENLEMYSKYQPCPVSIGM